MIHIHQKINCTKDYYFMLINSQFYLLSKNKIKMKTSVKYSKISAIQSNKNEISQEAQQNFEKYQGNLPPIGSVRNYLFKTIESNQIRSPQTNLLKNEANDIKNISKRRSLQRKYEGHSVFKQKTSIYNIELTKKSPYEQNFNNYRTTPLNPSCLKLRVGGILNSSQYLGNINQKTEFNKQKSKLITQRLSQIKGDKLNTILITPNTIDFSDKDLDFGNNLNDFSPKFSSKLKLPKKQSQVLQKYISRFKSFQSQQLNTDQQKIFKNQTKLTEIAHQSSELIQNSIRQQIEQKTDNNCGFRKIVNINLITLENPEKSAQSYGKYEQKQKLEKKSFKFTHRNKGKNVSMHEKIVEQCTPWKSDQQSNNNFDFL